MLYLLIKFWFCSLDYYNKLTVSTHLSDIDFVPYFNISDLILYFRSFLPPSVCLPL